MVSYDLNGNKIKEVLFGDGGKAVFADVNADGAAVVAQKKQEYILIVFDRNGNSVYNDYLSGAVESIRLYDSFVFADSDDSIMRINLSNKSVSKAECLDFDGVMLVKSDQEVLLCLPERVKYIKFE
jgi:archaeosine-15-forming tRNA-guanine transglycosylase